MGWIQVDVGQSHTWTLDVDDGSNPAETYTSTPALSNAVDALDDLLAWLNGGGRVWTGSLVFAYTVATGPTGRAVPTVTANGAFGWSPSAVAQATYGWPVHAASNTTTSIGLAGGWYPQHGLHLRKWLRRLDKGKGAADGVTRPGTAGDAGLSGELTTVCPYTEIASLQAILRAAVNPRRAIVLDDLAGDWVSLALGGVTQERQETHVYRVRLTATGA